MRFALISGHQLGSSEIRVILFEDVCEGAQNLVDVELYLYDDGVVRASCPAFLLPNCRTHLTRAMFQHRMFLIDGKVHCTQYIVQQM